ncbi:RnfABCDGE type electron transport complex subunit D [Duncaniella freteri]|uniref:Ion-translocating oxidoreductase complex subunit D n=9 Tax=Duncaniella TaxID=2518495 RepID=A0A4Z0V9Z6_9BACT|nr:RnfABCDGE type electron transport complex subunit D [Duncaniella freteri]MDE7026756.1 RnfABCDGE type electron transport complex subunit D [Duncaniella freteri]NBJ07093.1 RnfABCDGE type electron transport complex subunit D [Alistipes sp. Z76]NCE69197.1 RnfABCDGE type electron transport complex subunit D [Muribaculaceae bacterium M3]TGG40288.1 RnfABCDGE type electron transport complex subunit D [Duncaniella freteri]
MDNLITISPSPHAQTPTTVSRLMLHVIIALVPAVLFALYYFGIGAAIVIATSIVGCIAAEYLITRYMLGRKPSIGNLSAVLTGLLLALNLPSNIPVWMVLIGCVVAIGIGKMTFGGLGCNIFNPALVGRVFLLLSFPVAMTTWPEPIVNRMAYTDATTGATILGQLKQNLITPDQINLLDAALGNMGGSMGEVGAIALLLGFAYLLCFRVITWHIPVAIIGTAALFSLCIGAPVGVEILSGGMLLGAIFMATDYVTSPMSRPGMLLYGAMIGIITIIIRQWGAYPEGMSFAILIMNGVTPLINRYMKPRKFGEGRATA